MTSAGDRPAAQAAAEADELRLHHDVFISYSHLDVDVARRLRAGLLERGKQAWMDESDIPAAARWAGELQRAIEASDAFVFLVSPSSLASVQCRKELEHALELNKRVVLVRVLETSASDLPVEVPDRHVIPPRGTFTEHLERSLASLIGAMDADLPWVREHTEWGQKALEWHRHDRDRSFLLSGAELDAAEQWLAQGPGRRPESTELQKEFALESRRAATRRLRRTSAMVTVALVVAIGLAIFAFVENQIGVANKHTAQSRQFAADANSAVGSDPSMSAQLATRALAISHTADAETSLRNALPNLQALRMFSEGSKLNGAGFSPDGARVVTAGGDGTARVIDVASGREVTRRRGASPIESAAFSPDGRRIVTASDDGTAVVWDASTGQQISSISASPGSKLHSAAFSPDGRRVVTASDSGTAGIWNAQTGSRLAVINEPGAAIVFSAAFSPDGTKVVTATNDTSARIWNTSDGRQLLAIKDTGYPAAADFSPDGQRIVTADTDGFARIWDASSGAPEGGVNEPHFASLSTAAFGPDGHLLVTSSSDGVARVWDWRAGVELTELLGHHGSVSSAAFSADGTRVATAGIDGTARVWYAMPREMVGRLNDPSLTGPRRTNVTATYSPDGRLIATTSSGGARVWDSAGGKLLTVLRAPEDAGLNGVAFGSSANRIVTTSQSGIARVWDTSTRRSLATLREPGAASINSAALGPADGRVVTASDDGTARVWRAATGAQLVVLREPGGGRLESATFSRDGARILTAGQDGTARLWNATTGAPLLAISEPKRSGMSSAEFNASGTEIVTASQDGTTRVWDARDGRQLAMISEPGGATVSGAAFSRDGRWIVTASVDGAARIWDAGPGGQLATLHTQPGGINMNSAEFSPDGREVLTASSNGPAVIWSTELAASLAKLRRVAQARTAYHVTPAASRRHRGG